MPWSSEGSPEGEWRFRRKLCVSAVTPPRQPPHHASARPPTGRTKRRSPLACPDMTADKRLGIVSVAFGSGDAGIRRRADAPPSLGFDHIDIGLDRLEGEEPELALPIGDRIGSEPRTGCTVRPPRKCTWDEGVAFLRQQPDIRVEPGPRSLLDTAESIRAMCDAVPGLKLTLDTGLVGLLRLRPVGSGGPRRSSPAPSGEAGSAPDAHRRGRRRRFPAPSSPVSRRSATPVCSAWSTSTCPISSCPSTIRSAGAST